MALVRDDETSEMCTRGFASSAEPWDVCPPSEDLSVLFTRFQFLNFQQRRRLV